MIIILLLLTLSILAFFCYKFVMRVKAIEAEIKKLESRIEKEKGVNSNIKVTSTWGIGR